MFANLSVKARLGLSFSALVAIVLAVSFLSILQLSAANARFSGYIAGIGLRKDLATDLLIATQQRAIAARNLVLVTQASDRALEHQSVLQAHEKVQADLARLTQAMTGVSAEEQALVAEIGRIEALYGPVALDIVRLALADERDEAITRINSRCLPLLRQLLSAGDDYLRYSGRAAQAAERQAADTYATQRNLMLGASLLAMLVAIGLAVLITRALFRALGAEPVALSAAARRVAAGDMRPVAGVERAEAGSVLASLGEMQRSLGELIREVQQSAGSISSSAGELSRIAEQTSRAVGLQKQEMEQVATAMHQMAVSVHEVALNCEHAAGAATSAEQRAEAGSGLARGAAVQIEHLAAEVGRSSQAMQRLRQESQQIGGVLDVIKAVADQTNLLALNAAIEAARAGEAGRGFAVVADEVRSLARRTQDATHEIQSLIGSLQRIAEEAAGMMQTCHDLTDDTVASVGQAGDAVEAITRMISDIQQRVQQTAAATEQQSAVAEQISASVVRVRDGTDDAAVATGRTADASSSLNRLGDLLQQQVGRFQF